MAKPATFGDVYARLCERWPDPRERGRRFEPLVADVLRTDRTFRARFREVWLWSDWPGRDGPDNWCDIVAERRDGGLTAIQCKCYGPAHTLRQGDLQSFLGRDDARFSELIAVATSAGRSRNLGRYLSARRTPVQLIDLFGADGTTIDWDAWLEDEGAPLEERPRRELRDHQREALEDAARGLEGADRGKLIMACGTGKTLTGLRLAERIAGAGGRVLFCAPSISLLDQAQRHWAADAEIGLRTFAVCSDAKVGRNDDGPGAHPHDLRIPPTTDPRRLAEGAGADSPGELTAVFSTYQSLGAVRDAQLAGLPEFDLVVCDEAHRTTGYVRPGEDPSGFTLVHDGAAIRARKRLYMTATPRLYGEAGKGRAAEGGGFLASMDDEDTYGPELHRLGFDAAVRRNLLSDYEVVVLAVGEDEIAPEFPRVREAAGDLGERLRAWLEKRADGGGLDGILADDIGRAVGCLNGLAKIGARPDEFGADPEPMRRAVAFSNSIAASEYFRWMIRSLSRGGGDAGWARRIGPEVEHVDGTHGVAVRNERLAWLSGEPGAEAPAECRVLTNARCLSEGVDVPALDAVLFMQPRKSQIDVVQAVGRVMRRAEGKRLGYVILPIVVPGGASADGADALLADDEGYGHIWQVLQALRSHDGRLDAWINRIALEPDAPGPVRVFGLGGGDGAEGGDGAGAPPAEAGVQAGLDIAGLSAAIRAKIVEKCGDRQYWPKWAASVARIAAGRRDDILGAVSDPGSAAGRRFGAFLEELRGSINGTIAEADAAAMLAQHHITKPIFDALFGGSRFVDRNPVAQAMERMTAALSGLGLETGARELELFYESVRVRLGGMADAAARQQVLADLYDNFFSTAFRDEAEAHGMTYTPVELVDFVVRAAADLLRSEFGVSPGGEGVHVLDPFAGTGTFTARLLQSGLIPPDDLRRKYRRELHANEIMPLAYYIAAANAETAYEGALEAAGMGGAEYEPFRGIVLADTFQASEGRERAGRTMFPRNSERMERQLGLGIRVVFGNPPWRVGKKSADRGAGKMRYPGLDGRIAATYAEASDAGSKQALYDSYVRAVRWASDRVLGKGGGGIVAYVTNGGFIEGKAFDGFRRTLAREFHSVHVYNLRGNARTSSEQRRREGGGVFEAGSRAGVAILLLAKRPGPVPEGGAEIRYRDIGGYLPRERKLEIVAGSSLGDGEWETIVPNRYGDWILQRSERFLGLRRLAAVGSQPGGTAAPLFGLSSVGLATSRDAWAYGASEAQLRERVAAQAAFYNESARNRTIARDPRRFSWDRETEKRAKAGREIRVSGQGFREAVYRPFFKRHVYFDRSLNAMIYRLPRIFPSPETRTPAIVVESRLRAPGRTPGILAVDVVPDIKGASGATGDPAHVFPRYVYDEPPPDAGQGEFPLRAAIAGA